MHDGRVDTAMELLHRLAVGGVEGPDHDPVGLHEVLHRRPLGRELRVRGVADVTEPALVEAVAHLLARADRDGGLHDHDDLLVDRRQLVDDRPDGREVGVAGKGRRRPDGDVDELGAVDRLRHVEREGQPLAVAEQECVEPRLVDRHLAATEPVDPLGEDVAHRDLVAELGEAGPRHEPDVAGAEDGDALARYGHIGPHDSRGKGWRYEVVTCASGLRPFAIAIIVSFERRSSRVLTTQ